MIGDAGHEDPGASLGAGIFGTPLMVTSAENTGIVRLTRVRSRFVTAGAGVLLIVCGLITPLTRLLAAIPEPVVGAAGLTIYAVIATMGFGMLSRENLGHGTNGIVVALALCVGHPPPAPLIETSHTAYDDGMTGLSEGTRRRTQGTCASAVSGWLFVLFAMVSCCSITAPAAHASGDRPATVARTITPTHQALARIVVADSPEDRGTGSSCHGPSEHSTPVVLPGQSAPAALPGTTVTAAVAPLTGAAAIRGPSNDAVREVDHLRLQVQRI